MPHSIDDRGITLKNTIAITLASAGLLALSACGDNDVDNTAMDTPAADMTTTDTAMMDDAYPVAGELTPAQQTAYDRMDRKAISDEYDTNNDAIMTEYSGADTASDGAMAQSGQDSSVTQNSQDMQGGATKTMPARGEMDFAFLDRNDDGKLSTAEYAIWAVPANPTKPKANDSTKPYLTQDQINEAGQTFFYFDEDGDTYLQPAEFEAARSSARTPG